MRKIFPVLWLLLLWPLAALAADPTPVPAMLVDGVWIVKGTVGERPAYFLVDTGANRTGLLPDPAFKLGDFDIDLKIGDLSAHTTAYVANIDLLQWIKTTVAADAVDTKPVIGILGMDVLSQVAVGFDFAAGQVTFWAKGKLDSSAALSWVEQKYGAEKSVRLELTKRFGERFGVPFAFGTAKGWGVLDSGAASTSLLPRFGKKIGTALSKTQAIAVATSEMENRLIPEAMLGPTTVPWLSFGVGNPGEGLPGNPDGVVALGDLRSRRVLLDLAGTAAYYAPVERNKSLEIALGILMMCPLVFEEDTLRVGPYLPGFEAGLKTFEYCKITTVAGYPVRDVAAAIKGTDAKSQKFMIEFAKKVQTDFTIVIIYQNQSFNLNAHPKH